ncbi:surface-associated interspersed protein (SURFIN) [Plasmodium relictum]|uniref:Surface-associated interspersed protein (SURFIN) n=1 Tax=Plasmodium relictum TaxID=85471 RepID=A0A1J1GKL7_PLARL|nr:surface-associated interspersed protein (SURFIN) [Plasmodium relictum]CRG85678.1 surface-associated interspersed protein (SURFIN) [Plasmodium relictum]
MLCIMYFFFICQFCILIKITISQEFQTIENKSKLKEGTRDNNDDLSALLDEILDENIIQKSLLYNEDISSNSQDISLDLPSTSFILQNDNLGLLDTNSDLQDIDLNLMNTNFDLEDVSLPVTCSDLLDMYLGILDTTLVIKDISLSLPNASSILQNDNLDLSDTSSDSQDSDLFSLSTGFDLQDVSLDLPNTSSILQNDNLDLLDTSSDSQNVDLGLPDMDSNLQDTNSDLFDTSLTLQDASSSSLNASSDLQEIDFPLNGTDYDLLDTHLDLPYTNSSSQDISSVLMDTGSNLQNNILYEQTENYYLQNNFNSENTLFDFQELESISQFNSTTVGELHTSLQNNASSINNYVSDLERTISQNYYFNLRDESTLTRADSYCNSEINKMLLKRRKEEETENDQAKKQKIQEYTYDDDINLSGDDSNLNEVEIDLNDDEINLIRDEINLSDCEMNDIVKNGKNNLKKHINGKTNIKIFSLESSQNVFKIECDELKDLLPDLQGIIRLLKEKFNKIARYYNSNIQTLKCLIEEELKNVDEEDFNRIKFHYNFNEEHNYKKQDYNFDSLSFKNKLKKPMIKLLDIYISLGTLIKNVETYESMIMLYRRKFSVISKTTSELFFNNLLFSRHLLSLDGETFICHKMLNSIKEMIEHIEKLESASSLDQNISSIVQFYVSYAIRQLGKPCRKISSFLKYLKRMNISFEDHKKILQIVFHFIQKKNEQNKKKLRVAKKNFFMKEVMQAFSKILLKEDNYISESLKRASTHFNINVEDLDINKTSLDSLLQNKSTIMNAQMLYLSFMVLVKYLSIRHQYHKAENAFKKLKTMVNKKNMKRLFKKTYESGNFRKRMLLKLKFLKGELSKIELNLVYRSLYSEYKNDMLSIKKVLNSLIYKRQSPLEFLRSLKKSLNDYLLLKREGEDVGKMEESILYMLFHTNEIMNECWINEIE